jgi:hypothetical protein
VKKPHVTEVVVGTRNHGVACSCGYVYSGYKTVANARLGAALHRLMHDVADVADAADDRG